MKILVVDDEPNNCLLLERHLITAGHQVVSVYSGEAAIELSSSYQPNLIIMDVVMSGINGYETTRRIRAQAGEHWFPIIFASAFRRKY